MAKKREILAVIHARGGSKRIPLKNLKHLGGNPLLFYPINLSIRSEFITRTIVSTDHDKISSTAISFGAEVPFKRPADISEDVASELVTLHAVNFLKKKESYEPEIVVTLTPATPFTIKEELDGAIEMLINRPEFDSVISVKKAQEFPEWMLRMNSVTNELETVLGNSLDGKMNVSQNLEKVFYLAGAFFINRVSAFLENKSLFGNCFGGYLLKQESVDIDEPEDLKKAEILFRENHEQ